MENPPNTRDDQEDMHAPWRSPTSQPDVGTDPNGPAKADSHSARWMIWLIMAGLMIWGGIHAVGAYGLEHGERDYRRGAVVVVCFALFLSIWRVLLLVRSRSLGKPD